MHARPPLLEVIILGLLALVVFLAVGAAFHPAAAPGDVVIRDITPTDGARVPARPVRLGAEVLGSRDLHKISLRINDQEVVPSIDQRDPQRWRITYQLNPSQFLDTSGQPLLSASDPRRVTSLPVVLTARDQHGRERRQAWTFQLDPSMSVPTFLTFQPPDKGYAPAGDLRISAVVQTDAPIDSVSLKVAGETYATTQEAAGPNRTTIVARVKLQPGSYQAALTIVDREGDRNVRAWDFRVPDPRDLLAFEQTGKAIGGGFRAYWQERGALPIFGLPISDEMREGTLTVQYFERARFEYHPRQDGLLSEVKLGLLGSDLRKPDPARPKRDNEPGIYFSETGHGLAGPFQAYWEEHGGLDLFGFPITDEVRQGNVTIQWFERARFELHVLNGTPTVLLGHIGREAYERRYGKEPAR